MAEFESRRVDGRTTVTSSDGRPLATETRTTVRDEPVVIRRTNNMGWLLALVIIVAAVVAAFAFKLIDINQLTSGSLPRVEAVGGSLPKFEVNTAKVVAGTRDETVKVPTMQTEEKTIKLPTLHVEKATDPANAPATADGTN
jgi:hypothetical protein